jgi:hypothetical protein
MRRLIFRGYWKLWKKLPGIKQKPHGYWGLTASPCIEKSRGTI